MSKGKSLQCSREHQGWNVSMVPVVSCPLVGDDMQCLGNWVTWPNLPWPKGGSLQSGGLWTWSGSSGRDVYQELGPGEGLESFRGWSGQSRNTDDRWRVLASVSRDRWDTGMWFGLGWLSGMWGRGEHNCMDIIFSLSPDRVLGVMLWCRLYIFWYPQFIQVIGLHFAAVKYRKIKQSFNFVHSDSLDPNSVLLSTFPLMLYAKYEAPVRIFDLRSPGGLKHDLIWMIMLLYVC